MFDKLKELGIDTLIYGVAQVGTKVINFALVPLFTFIMAKSELGMYTDLYTWIAFLLITLTFGSETAFFKFAQEIDSEDPDAVQKQETILSTAFFGVLGVSIVFGLTTFFFLEPLAQVMRYQDTPEILMMVLGILMLDVWAALGKAQLRRVRKAMTFVFINFASVVINIAVTLTLLLGIPKGLEWGWLSQEQIPWYSTDHFVQYVFVANLIASATGFLLVLPIYLRMKWRFDIKIFNKIWRFGIPLMIAGLAGMFNERADIQMIKYLLPEETALEEVGLYGTVYKFAMMLIIFNQVFRFAAEPFVFKHFKQRDKRDPEAKNSKEGLAQTTDWFVVVLSIALLGTLCSKVLIEVIIAKQFEEALVVLPVLLLANVFYAITTQLSFWYKLIEKTYMGMMITFCGALVTLALTLTLIPSLGYAGAAWATLGSYTTMMLISYFMGQKMNPYPYDVKQALLMIGVAMGLGMCAWHFASIWFIPQILCFGLYLLFLYWYLKPKVQALRAQSTASVPKSE